MLARVCHIATTRPEMSSSSDLSTVSPLSPSDVSGPLSPVEFSSLYAGARHEAFSDLRTVTRENVAAGSVPAKPPR